MLKQKLVADQIKALKNRDQEKLSILRYILAQIKNKEIEKRTDLKDEEESSVLRKIAKELHESIEAFTKGKRQDLILEYQKQLQVVSAYLPKEISDEELKNEIEKIVADNQDIYEKNPKAIIGICVKTLKNKADSSRIVKILQSISKS